MKRTEHPHDGKEAEKPTGLSGLAHTAETECSSSARSVSVQSSKDMVAHEGSSVGTPKKERPVWDIWERVLIEDVSATMEEKVFLYSLVLAFSSHCYFEQSSGTRCALVGWGPLGSLLLQRTSVRRQ